VLRNVHGGVEETGFSFELTPPRAQGRAQRHEGGQGFTPNKLLLTHKERHMNMLTPETSSSMYQADIETGKVVAEWTFQKDGVDVAMRDIVNETKGVSLWPG
jgi:VID27 C-terminal WD40-like domain